MEYIEAEVKQAQKLVGYQVVGVCRTANQDSFGLIVRKGSRTLNVWVDCDPEGNGPGHLNLEVEK